MASAASVQLRLGALGLRQPVARAHSAVSCTVSRWSAGRSAHLAVAAFPPHGPSAAYRFGGVISQRAAGLGHPRGGIAAYATSAPRGSRDVAPAIVSPERYSQFVESAALTVTRVSKLGEMNFGFVRAVEKGFTLQFPVRIVTPPLVTPTGVRDRAGGEGAGWATAQSYFALQLGDDADSAEFERFVADLERMVKDVARENAVQWWGEAKSEDWLEANLKPLLSERVEQDGAGEARLGPRRIYFNVRKRDALQINLREGPEGRASRAVPAAQQLPPQALVTATLDLTGIWFRADRFGISLKPVELSEAEPSAAPF
eukprot:tig00000093_g3548.t1